MGFNFGAFAAGALEGAGDLMAKQHKETKDTIDKNMTFAYQQGLPYHRARKEKQRKLEGYASDLSSMQLSSDQIDAVMGKSIPFIEDFIKSSQQEVKRTGGKFEVGSQINMKEGGRITPWKDVQLGTADTSTLPQQQPTSRRSLFSSMTGGNEASNAGFGRMKSRAQAEMEGITGASYDDVTAAGGGYYDYKQGSEADITMVDSASAMSYEYSAMQKKQFEDSAPYVLSNLIRSSKRAVTDDERADFLWKFTKKQAEYADKVGDARIAADIDALKLQQELDDITYKTKIGEYGTNPQDGYWRSTLALMDEQTKEVPDLEKIDMLEKHQFKMSILVDDQISRNVKAGQVVSYAQLEKSYKNRVLQILEKNVDPNNSLWVVRDGIVTFDFNRVEGQKLATSARIQAANEFTESARTSAARGKPVSDYLTAFMDYNINLDPDLATMPVAPTNKSEVKDETIYIIQNEIPLRHSPSQREKELLNDQGRIASYQPKEKEGFEVGVDKATPRVIVTYPREWRYEKIDGVGVKAMIDGAAAAQVRKEQGIIRDGEIALENQVKSEAEKRLVVQEQARGDFLGNSDGAVVKDPNASVSMWKQGTNAYTSYLDENAKFEARAEENKASLSKEEEKEIDNLYDFTFSSTRSFHTPLPKEELRAALTRIAYEGTNVRHMEWAMEQLAQLAYITE